MKVQIQDKDALDSLTVASLRAYLESHGWSNDRPWGTWSTILSKEERGKIWEVAVPNKAGGLLYAESVAEIIATLAEAEDRSQLDVFCDLAGESTDTVAAAPSNGSGKEGDNVTTPKLARLERVDLREEWKTEAQDFTPWLAQADNLAVLSETLNMELETAGQEPSVGLFRADILCRDTLDDSWVLIENQLERTDHTHLGQLLTYAAGLQTVTIIWVAATFTDEHRAALDWLNEITDERFRFFGLEVELWRIGNSPAAPKFNIVSKPNDWSRSIKRATTTGFSVNDLLHQRFWEQLGAYLHETRSTIIPKTPTTRPYTIYPIGRSGFSIDAYRSNQDNVIRVDLRISDGPERLAHFDLLMVARSDVEGEIGYQLEWRKQLDPSTSRIRLSCVADPSDESDWSRQTEWFAKTLEAFDGAFRQRLQSLNAADWQPDEGLPDE